MATLPLDLIAFGLLALALASLWIPQGDALWGGLLGVSVAFALYSHLLDAGGFHDRVIFSDVVLSPGAYPTSVIWSFWKPLAGLPLMVWGVRRAESWNQWKKLVPTALACFGLCAGLMMIGALSLHAIAWAPKWTRITTTFAFGNLFFVCIPEEVIFRGILQRKLAEALVRKPKGEVWSVVIASVLFGLCHVQGGAGLMLVAGVAGLFYGAAYQRTGRIEASILVHFLLNLTHFALFTYPALRPLN